MANEVVIHVKVDSRGANFNAVDRALENVGKSARRAGDDAARSFDRARDASGRFIRQTEQGVRASDHYRDANGRLRDSLGRFVAGAGQAAGAMGAANAASTALSGGLSALANVALAATGAAVGAGVAFVAMAPALLAVGGAAAAAAAGVIGLGAALATVGIGFGGIGDALKAHTKQMSAAGGGAANMAEQEHQAAMRVRNATRSLIDAKRAEKDAIDGVNRARQSEIERLQDLDSQIRSQTISEREAAQALQDAKDEQARIESGASDRTKAEAQTRVDRAQYEYDETVRRLKGLTEERKKADKVGIDGSDQVQEALKRQASAHEGVIRAQEQLAEAQRKVATASGGAAGGINAFDQAMKKLSPNAQELVRTLISLSDKWDALKKRVQDRFLAGAAEDTRMLAQKWFPALDEILGKMADRLNGVGHAIARTVGSDSFINNIKKASDEGGKFIAQIGGGIPALLDGFARLGASAGPVLAVIGKHVRALFEWFDRWIKSAEKSGALDRFMKSAAESLDKIFTIGKLAFQIIGEFVSIIFPSSKAASDSIFDSVIKQLEGVKKWLQDPQNREAIKRIADGVKEFMVWLVETGIPMVIKFGTAFEQVVFDIVKYWSYIEDAAALAYLNIRSGWLRLMRWIAGQMLILVDTIDATLGRVVPGLSAKLGDARKRIGDFAKSTNKELASIRDKTINIEIRQVFTAVGEIAVDVARKLGRKAAGGVQGAASGGARSGLTWVGEQGPELVRLSPGSQVYSNPDSMRMAGQGGSAAGAAHMTGTLKLTADRTLERGVIDALFKMFRVEISNSYGGDVQLALGA